MSRGEKYFAPAIVNRPYKIRKGETIQVTLSLTEE